MALYSTANTSMRSAMATIGLANSHIGEMSAKAQGIIFAAGILIPVVGWGIAMGIYEIMQRCSNEPHKKQEQLLAACRFAGDELGDEKEASYNVTDDKNDIINYEQDDNKVFVTHTNGNTKAQLFKDEKGTPFTSLKEFQDFRRQDILKNYATYKNEMSPEWHHYLNKAAESALRAELSKLEGSNVPSSLVDKLAQFYGVEAVNAAYDCIVEAKIELSGVQLLELVKLHNTLGKIGTADFNKAALENFKHVYNLESRHPTEEPQTTAPQTTITTLRNENLKLSDKDKQIMLRIEIAKLDPNNAANDPNLHPNSPDRKKVNQSISCLLHQLYRPDDFCNPKIDGSSAKKPEFKSTNSHGPLTPEFGKIGFKDDGADTVFGFFTFSNLENPSVDLVPALVSFALNYNFEYKANEKAFKRDQYAELNRTVNKSKISANNAVLESWIETSESYKVPATKLAINSYIAEVIKQYKTLYVSVNGGSRNGLTNKE